MAFPRLALSIIGDEISSSLAQMISFCLEQNVRRLDMRTVDGRDLLSMELDEVNAIALAVEKAGLMVSTFVSPLLRWPAPGKAHLGDKLEFAFDPTMCPSRDPIAYAFDVAGVLRAPRLRVSSYARYDGFDPMHLVPRIERIMDLAEGVSISVELENEPDFNIGSVAELVGFFAAYPQEPLPTRLKAMPNLANAWAVKEFPTDADIAAIVPYLDALRLKDFDATTNCVMPVGDGNIPWADELVSILKSVEEREILLTIGTGCAGAGGAAAARSIAAVRRIADEIGATLT